MSEFDRGPHQFPDYTDVAHAYSAVVDLQHTREDAEYRIKKLAEGDSEPKLLPEIIGSLSLKLEQAQKSDMEEVKSEHCSTFKEIGLELSDDPETFMLEGMKTEIPRAQPIFFNILNPYCYADYLDNVSTQNVYSFPHFKLVKRVIDSIFEKITDKEAIIDIIDYCEGIKGVAAIDEQEIEKEKHLADFKAIMFVHYKHNLQFIPAYKMLAKKVLAHS